SNAPQCAPALRAPCCRTARAPNWSSLNQCRRYTAYPKQPPLKSLMGVCHTPLPTHLLSHHFNFGGRNYRTTIPRRKWWQIHLFHPPAAMAKQTAQRRLPRDIADQFDRRRIKARFDGDRSAFLFGHDRFEPQVMLKHLPAVLMRVPDGGADLGVLVGRDVFGEEVNQPPVTLQEGEHLDGAVSRFDCRLFHRRGPCDCGRRGLRRRAD